MTAKRTKNALLALLLCIALSLSLTACGSKESSSDNKGGDGSSKIAAFIDSASDQLDSMGDLMGDTLDIKLEARGNALAYVFRYKEDTGMDNKTMADVLNSSLDAMSSTFTAVLEALQKEVPEAESVIVEYQDKDGNVITSKEFK